MSYWGNVKSTALEEKTIAEKMPLKPEKKRCPAVRVVILTGYSLEDGSEELESAGVVGWVRKPVDLDQLAQVVARALEE